MIPVRYVARHVARGTSLVRPISTISLARCGLLGQRAGLSAHTAPSAPVQPGGKRFYAARKTKEAVEGHRRTKGEEEVDNALELRYRLLQRKTRILRAEIIAEYPDVRAALDVIYGPDYKTCLPFQEIVHYVTAKRYSEPASVVPAPGSLADLLKAIGKPGGMTKAKAKEMMYHFIIREKIDINGVQGTILNDLMHRKYLDGVGPYLLSLVPPADPGRDATKKKTRLNDPEVRERHRKRAMDNGWGYASGYTGKRAYSTVRPEYPNPEVVKQLLDLRELKTRVNDLSKQSEKQAILKDYPQLRELLELISQESFRTNLTYDSFQKFLEKHKHQGGKQSTLPPPTTTIELLRKLSEKVVTGDAAKTMVDSFLDNHDVRRIDPKLEHIFGSLLDRKPNMGISLGTLRDMSWGDDAGEKTGSTANLSRFPVALGNAIDGDPLLVLSAKFDWYASRKLDGVRCITTMDIFVPFDVSKGLSLVDLSLQSRSGKDYPSLANLRPQLERLVQAPKLRQYLATDTFTVEEQADGVVKRLVLDGECCVMVPVSSLKDGKRAASVLTTETDGDSHRSAAAELWKDDGLIEDFAATQSQVARKSQVVEHPRFYLFDLIPGGEFTTLAGTTTFSERNARLNDLVDWLEAQLVKDGIEERMIKRMVQIKVDLRDLDGMYARSAEEGWEGLIFRADRPYKGSRTNDIRKYKEFKDDDYVVKAVNSTTMRLAVDGVYADRRAAGSVTIIHDGIEVQVGSGITPEERMRWAEDPSSIVGKTITVKYFGESANQDRPGQMSLRFPIIKAIYDGARDM